VYDEGESKEEIEKTSFSLKQLIRKLHITEPVCCSFFYVPRVEVRSDCLFCWPSLLKLSNHKDIVPYNFIFSMTRICFKTKIVPYYLTSIRTKIMWHLNKGDNLLFANQCHNMKHWFCDVKFSSEAWKWQPLSVIRLRRWKDEIMVLKV
jgi:hypothetical protein